MNLPNPSKVFKPQIPDSISLPHDHAVILHPDGRGRVTLAVRKSVKWHEESVSIEDLPRAANEFSQHADVYLGQNRFYGRRRVTNLSQLDALYIDIDFYKRGITASPETVLKAVKLELDARGLPSPSLSIASGRGLYVIWPHTPVPRKAINRWSMCQKMLCEALIDLGGDTRSLDAARVLRLVGTVNSKSQSLVYPLEWDGTYWDFEILFNEIAPIERAELRSLKLERTKRGQRGPTPKNWMNSANLWESRLAGLQYWRQHIRWFGELPPGERDAWMFWAANATAWITPPSILRRELFELSQQCANWDDKEAGQRLAAIMNRASMLARGETIEWRGQQVSPLYHAKEQTIIDYVGITPSEQAWLYDHFGKPILCGEDLRKQYQRDRWHKRRESSGGVPREEYLANAATKRLQARELREQGMSIRAISKSMKTSVSQVQRLLS